MSDDKRKILAALRQSLSTSQHAAPPDTVERLYRREGEDAPGSAPVLAEFVAALEDYSAEVAQVPASGVAEAVATFLDEADARSVVVPHGLDASWVKAAGASGRELLTDSVETPVDKMRLAEVDAVVTASRTAVSLSGAIALDGEADQGRRIITLLPDVHVCVVDASTVQPTVPQAVKILGEHPQRPTTWLAGGSATSDIELVRVNGVHGPRRLRVVLVTDR
ncbi:LUD domain-containing protein [Schaalia sp. 19OD2882]|uniref:LutC/YkgG family protein n=1 Tax=Schaalia sp. 19OD2882 TaxID=2794089 RepID=UPI001C1EC88F|nr:LUD domain-containing protein [Schaalia sp. 19OD2882]QWW19921.1 LUD domain-containing protein [Schaalia sp. 19OD2882]